MRTTEEIQESNFQLLKQFIQNNLDSQQSKEPHFKDNFNKKSYLKEFATIKFGTNRKAGHTIGMLRCLWEFPFYKVLFLTWRNDASKNTKKIFKQLVNGYLINPINGICPIPFPTNNSFCEVEFKSWNSDFLIDSGKVFDLVIVDCYSFMSTTKEDEIYNLACQWNTKLLVFLE